MISNQERRESRTNRVEPWYAEPLEVREEAPVAQTVFPTKTATRVGGEPLGLEYVQGRVCGLDRQTRVYHSTTQDSNGVTVNTWSETKTEFHLVQPDGTENPYWHMYTNIPLRNGQTVTNVHLNLGRNRVWALLVNHSNGQATYMRGGAEMMYQAGAIVQVCWWWFVLYVVAMLGVSAMGVATWSAVVVGFAVFVVAKFIQWVRALLLWRKVKPEVDAVSDRLLAK